MTPSSQAHPTLTTTNNPPIIKHNSSEAEPAKKSRFSPSYYDVYPMVNGGGYSPGNGIYQSNSFARYSGTNSPYPNVSQYSSNGTQAAIMNGPPTPQFVQGSLGPSSPITLASTFSTPQFQSPAAYMPSPQLSPASHQTARTVYVGNIPTGTPISDILDHVRVGNIDSVRPLPEKNCAFITFVEASSAAQFYHEATSKKLIINGAELRIGWGRPSSIPANIHVALQNGASRNVFFGSLDDTVTEQYLRDNLLRFGQIEHIKLIKDKNIAFVHFLSTFNAIKCVTTLPTEPQWASRRINYGRDRCAPLPKSSSNMVLTQHHPMFSPSTAYPVRFPSYDPYAVAATVESYPTGAPATLTSSNVDQAPLAGIANRTIYLGNIHPDTTCEEICNVIRGGILSQIRYLQDKHIAFITFVDPALALHFFNQSIYHGLIIKNRRLKIGWGKASALSPAVISAVQNGGSRNVYLGNIDETITEEKLKQDFSDYGEIELVNTLKEKNCAFVNFTSIAAAVRAIEGIRAKEEYKKYRINYGKDRCGNPPRTHRAVQRIPEGPFMTSNVTSTELDESDITKESVTTTENLINDDSQGRVNGVLQTVLVPSGI
ncbi:hypothetical protein K492DRAFT_175742 [Lichtheimia hyalospora FSU 10163]|nr:hypothetical protein K492DRAFT_175742 [Lichtheimia hyalospora FSU 10163]